MSGSPIFVDRATAIGNGQTAALVFLFLIEDVARLFIDGGRLGLLGLVVRIF